MKLLLFLIHRLRMNDFLECFANFKFKGFEITSGTKIGCFYAPSSHSHLLDIKDN